MMSKGNFPIETKWCFERGSQPSEISQICKWLLRWGTVFPDLMLSWNNHLSIFMFTCGAFLHGGGNLWELGQWFPNEALSLLSAASMRETLILSILYSGTLCKILWLKKYFSAYNFFLYTDLYIWEKRKFAGYIDVQELSPNYHSPYSVTLYKLLNISKFQFFHW